MDASMLYRSCEAMVNATKTKNEINIKARAISFFCFWAAYFLKNAKIPKERVIPAKISVKIPIIDKIESIYLVSIVAGLLPTIIVVLDIAIHPFLFATATEISLFPVETTLLTLD